jgi:hypothetical protein
MAFTVTSDSAEGSAAQNYLRPGDAYRRARECEANGIRVTIRLPTGDEVSAEEFRDLYLLRVRPISHETRPRRRTRIMTAAA